MQTNDTATYSDYAGGTCTREEFVEAARKYLDVPFRHQGRTKKSLDCAGLLVRTASDCGLESWDPKKHIGYDNVPDGRTVNRIMSALMDKLPATEENLLPGNVVQTSYVTGGKEMVTHMGILTSLQGELSLIHAYFPLGKVVEHALDEQWLARVTGVFRPRGLVD